MSLKTCNTPFNQLGLLQPPGLPTKLRCPKCGGKYFAVVCPVCKVRLWQDEDETAPPPPKKHDRYERWWPFFISPW